MKCSDLISGPVIDNRRNIFCGKPKCASCYFLNYHCNLSDNGMSVSHYQNFKIIYDYYRQFEEKSFVKTDDIRIFFIVYRDIKGLKNLLVSILLVIYLRICETLFSKVLDTETTIRRKSSIRCNIIWESMQGEGELQ